MYNYEKQKTYPNQKMITIHKDPVKENFLQVNICEGQEAFATLPRISFGLYLYLCGNQDKFNLTLSSVDVQKSLGVSDSSYRRAVEDLLATGYLMMRNCNEHTLDFYTTLQPTGYVKKERKKKSSGAAASVVPDVASDEPPADEEDLFPSFSFSHY